MLAMAAATETMPVLPSGVIQKKEVKDKLKNLYQVPLIPLKVGFGVVKESTGEKTSLQKAVMKEAKKQGRSKLTM